MITTVREAWRTALPDNDRHWPLPPLMVLLTVVTGLIDHGQQALPFLLAALQLATAWWLTRSNAAWTQPL
jgi:hypothetical protein